MKDKDILKLFNEEDNKHYAFNLLVNIYSERLYWHIRKLTSNHEDTNDILQNVFIKAWNALPKFREDSSLFTWLYRIATNESLSFLKKERLINFFSISDHSTYINNKIESDEYFDGDEIQLKLKKAINALPPKQRVVFNLKYFDELKYEEIADILGGSIGSLKASYHHAYIKIQKLLKEEN